MDDAFFILSKVFWTLARPETWLLIPAVFSLVAQVRRRRKAAIAWSSSALAVTLTMGMFPIGEALLLPLERTFPPRPEVLAPSGIIVLGGAEDAAISSRSGLPELNEAAERFSEALRLARLHPNAILIFTGSGGSSVAGQIFSEAGISPDRIILEGSARNTAENARLTRDLVSIDAKGPWILVTSAFHMPRSLGAFCAAGWRNIVPYPVDFRAREIPETGWNLGQRLQTLGTGVKEWIGLLSYRVTGRTLELIPGAC